MRKEDPIVVTYRYSLTVSADNLTHTKSFGEARFNGSQLDIKWQLLNNIERTGVVSQSCLVNYLKIGLRAFAN